MTQLTLDGRPCAQNLAAWIYAVERKPARVPELRAIDPGWTGVWAPGGWPELPPFGAVVTGHVDRARITIERVDPASCLDEVLVLHDRVAQSSSEPVIRVLLLVDNQVDRPRARKIWARGWTIRELYRARGPVSEHRSKAALKGVDARRRHRASIEAFEAAKAQHLADTSVEGQRRLACAWEIIELGERLQAEDDARAGR